MLPAYLDPVIDCLIYLVEYFSHGIQGNNRRYPIDALI